MRKKLLSMFAMTLVLGAAFLGSTTLGVIGRAKAESKPLVVATVTSLDNIGSDAEFVGSLAGSPEIAIQFKVMLGLFSNGVDSTRPFGVIISAGDDEITPLGFVPVKDAKNLDVLMGNLAIFQINTEKGDDGIYEVEAGFTTLFVQQQNNWAVVAQSAEALKSAPKNPGPVLAALSKSHDVAVEVHVQNVPDSARDMMIDALRSGIELSDRLPGESEEQYALRKKLAKGQITQLIKVIDETDKISLGVSLDASSKTAYVDFTFRAVPGTKTAKQFETLNEAKTNYGGLMMPGASFTLNLSSTFDQKDALEANKAALDIARKAALKGLEDSTDFPNEQVKKMTAEAVGNLIDVLEQTMASGKVDGVASVVLKPKGTIVLAGGHLIGGKKLEKSLNDFVNLAKNEKKFPGVTVTKSGDVTFHSAKIPLPDKDAVKVFGETLEVVIGFSDTSIYAGVGKDAFSELQKAIAASKASPGKSVDPVNFTVSLASVMRFAAQMEDDEKIAQFAKVISQYKDSDKVSLTARGIKNGARYRLEIEEGVLRLIGAVAKEGIAGGRRGDGISATSPLR